MKSVLYSRVSVKYAIIACSVGIFFLLSLYSLELFLECRSDPSNIASRIETVLREKEARVNKILNKYKYENLSAISRDENFKKDNFSSSIKNTGIAFQQYLKDSLVFWTDNTVGEIDADKLQNSSGIQKLPNGWYELIVSGEATQKAVFLILIKNEYSFENEYLENSFQKDFDVTGDIGISMDTTGIPVKSASGTILFYLDFSSYEPSFDSEAPLLTALLIIAFLTICLALYYAYSAMPFMREKPWLFLMFFATDVVLIRLLQAWFRFPSGLYSTAFFSPLYYSSSGLLPSEGDYLINSFVLLVISFAAFLRLYRKDPLETPGRIRIGILATAVITFILAIYLLLCFGLDDLVKNSSFSLDLKDISKIGTHSAVGLFIVYALCLSFYLLARMAASYLVNSGKNVKIICAVLAGVICFIPVLLWRDSLTAFILTLLFEAFLAYLLLYFRDKPKNNMFSNIVLPMIWMSVLVAAVFNNTGFIKEREGRKIMAVKLASEKNPLTELLFNKLERKLLSDTTIISMASDTGSAIEDALVKRIKSAYIRDFWNRYTVQITLCYPGKLLKIQPRGYVFDCEQYFRQVCDKVGEKTANPNLYYLDYGTGIETYLAVIRPANRSLSGGEGRPEIYIEFNAKSPAKDLGYPELLIDRRIMNIPDPGNYSYALYQSGSLVYKTGKYTYSLHLNDLVPAGTAGPFFSSGGMSHYRYNLDKSRVLIISNKDDSFLGLISPASYLFILFSFLTLVLALVFRPSILGMFSFLTLKNRFQFANVSIIVISFLILGCLLLYFLIRLNNLKNMDSFSERTLSVMTEMEDKFGDRESLAKTDKTLLEESLQRLSGMFYTDVNVYSPAGKLLLSSRPQVFDEGLISRRMNYAAFTALKSSQQAAIFRDETIGTYNYTSAYFPLMNDRNELLAYINLPFFSRQEDLKREINDFLVAFMNLYILFILISVFVSVAISRYLSAPLGLLVSRMEVFKLGKRNEKISWKHPDEIGRLVEEYNRLIDELAFSADQLAKSERESAWREMARQVAHEIKNPLTPMKLSVQHLRKAWDDRSEDFNMRLARFTTIMTEQIDSLSAIATEFSDFAKMPMPVEEELDLAEIVTSVISMYSGLENISIEFEPNGNMTPITGDRKQLVRVFTNLVNNSVQAIGNNANGRISIGISRNDNQYTITIEDNGSGIPSELADKIFLPNFTTKTSGAGLGLAIVRGIIRSMGGDVTFASGNQGTIFTITIPLHHETASF